MELHSVRLGSDPRLFNSDPDKPPVAYVSLAETQRVYNRTTRQWEDGETRWFDGQFSGRDAELITQLHQKGDALYVWGDVTPTVTEKDGERYMSNRLSVSAFAPNPRITDYSISREARQDFLQTAGMDMAQDASQRWGQAEAASSQGQFSDVSRAINEARDLLAEPYQPPAQQIGFTRM